METERPPRPLVKMSLRPKMARARLTVDQLMSLDKDMRDQNLRILNSITDVSQPVETTGVADGA